ncbi:pyrroloquinoline quinone-dependent dehydrogenase [Erythrobacter sp.]|uniref:pyrroloquinoline quinone-dependent dehydrogenase n=1 Tax=Erythrobacter sp. TaxID=1042 RepID=UPI001B02F6A1|nr:pyrroloquinoline quinone-dependent dehydrogenase [Erythrobacter sp.]MBO6526616.1 pyrroloquinoline quinone-dependent dehydrogenase [Erythrobacter sp.]MBO6529174.1 pyrroloquinoline quinone-dependent dehydrogenase [Erythrobacter sp.]
MATTKPGNRKLAPLKVALAILGLFAAVSLLGGTAIWSVLGLADDLDIDGRAAQVRTVEPGFGAGWGAYGGDALGSRYSNAAQITPENVGDLEIAWQVSTGALEGRDSARSRTAFQTTPILVEDRLVLCTQFNEVIALAPDTGKEIWRHDPQIPIDGRPANQFTCRGVSYWQGEGPDDAPCSSRIFSGTVDARLIALDTHTGRPCAEFGDGGSVRIEPSMSLRWPGEFQITSAPTIMGDVVITGSAIGDNLRTDAPVGIVHAFDARSGEPLWTFNPVPRDPNDPARESWAGNSADTTGHANVWSTISVDARRGLVFLPTSSPSPDYFGGNRVGDNRYANSVVALDGRTGEVAWHFQTVHHDLWDYDVPAQPGLYQVWKDGRAHDVVAQVTKTGHVFVLDRETGEPFLPVEERPVPQGGVEGEVLSPTQPFPVRTPPLVRNTLDPWDAFGVTLWDRWACANAISDLRREGLYTPPSEQGTLAYPFTGGGANWGSAAFDPGRNLLVVNMNNVAAFVRLTRRPDEGEEVDAIEDGAEFAPMEGSPYVMHRAPLLSPLGLPCSPPPWGVLAAVDLASGEIVWRRTLGTTEDLAPGGIALDIGTPSLGGPVVTASGLVFIGATMDDYLRAFDVETGRELWKGRLPAGGQATPMTYRYGGRQYVVIAAGGHSTAGTRIGDSLVAFALPE